MDQWWYVRDRTGKPDDRPIWHGRPGSCKAGALAKVPQSRGTDGLLGALPGTVAQGRRTPGWPDGSQRPYRPVHRRPLDGWTGSAGRVGMDLDSHAGSTFHAKSTLSNNRARSVASKDRAD